MKKLWQALITKLYGHPPLSLKREYSGQSILLLAFLSVSGWLAAFHYYQIATAVPLISNDVLAQQTLAKTSVQSTWQTVEVKPQDSLQAIFKRVGLTDEDLMNVINTQKNRKIFSRLKPGEKIRFLISSDQELQQFVFPVDEKNNITLVHTDTGFVEQTRPQSTTISQKSPPPLETQIKSDLSKINPNYQYGFAIVQRSLYEAGIQAGLSRSQSMQLVTLFSQNRKLTRGIHHGDELSVLSPRGAKFISFAQLTHRGKTYQIFRYTDLNGNTDYYTADGASLHSPILRAPLSYNRISSYFSAHRWNPILHFVRPHYGVDYAARWGTPIEAAGDGKILFAGEENGYGKVIKIQHLPPYQTLYAHLSRFASGIHHGVYVHQGQIIGYVGDTGESTGSHLHFEIHVNNVPRNPLTVALPSGTLLPEKQRENFFAVKKEMLYQFTLNEEKTKLASNATKSHTMPAEQSAS